MGKKGIAILCMIGCLLFSGCGDKENSTGKENSTQEGTETQEDSGQKPDGAAEYLDISVSTRQAFDVLSWDWQETFRWEGQGHFEPMFLGMQRYQGETVQLWGAQTQPRGEVTKENCLDVFLCREDKSAQLLLQDIAINYKYQNWYLDRNGNFYIYQDYYMEGEKTLKVLDSDGTIIYNQKTDGTIVNICQSPNDRVYILMDAESSGLFGKKYILAEYDPQDRSVSKVMDLSTEWRDPYIIGEGENGILYMDADGFWEVDPVDKSRSAFMLFEGTTYYESFGKRDIWAIGVTDNGTVEVLRSNGRARLVGSEENLGIGEVETFKLEDIGRGRIAIVMRGLHFYSSWMKAQVIQFNEMNEDYYVVLEECPEGTDEEDFVRQTQIQIATGKGPNIMYGNLWEENVYSLIQKGVFEDLKPYMDNSGVREEDYFPLAFSNWRNGDKVYSVNTDINLKGYRIDEEVLGSRTPPDIETLINALLAYEEKACFIYNEDSMSLLRQFLEGSEDLWGMVDWERGTCDFSGELFAGILEAAGRFGYDERRQYPAIAWRRGYTHLLYDSLEEQEKEGKVTCGVMFDDGCYGASYSAYTILTMNVNSSHKEGAWQFLETLLGEEAQSALALEERDVPVYKKAFDALMEYEMEQKEKEKALIEKMQASSGRMPTLISSAMVVNAYGEYVMDGERFLQDLTEEKIAEFRAAIEEARPLPVRTEPILDIICDEALDYFNNVKSVDEVSAIIENRVNLYLDENR